MESITLPFHQFAILFGLASIGISFILINIAELIIRKWEAS